MILSIEGREELYLNSPLRPMASVGSGERYTALGDLRAPAHARDHGVPHRDRRAARRDGRLPRATGRSRGTTGIAIKFDSLIAAIDEKWTFALTTGVRHQTNDAPDPVFSTTDPKVTTQGFVEAKLTVPLGDNFALQSAASYTVSRSNYGLETYTNATASVGLSKGF